MVDSLQAGIRPTPTRGAPICSFKEIERQIAGFFTDATLAQDAPGTGVPTEAGVRLAVDRGESAPSYAARGAGSSRQEITAESAQPTSAHDAPLTTSAEAGKADADAGTANKSKEG